jgi:DUF2892 family protein
MRRNIGPIERYARFGAGVAAAIAAMRAQPGWQRTALRTIAAAGLGTALARYCPVNQAIGRTANGSRLAEGLRDAELRRQMALSSALGSSPSSMSGQPPVTRDSDRFGR